MHFGLMIFPTSYTTPIGELAAAAEARGFESLWVSEHSHIPASRETPWPGGSDLPQYYYDVMDPFVSLGAAAQATTTLKLGTGICLVAQRDPIQTAKQVASLDVVSNGRFLFGIGGGWNREEMRNHGTDPRIRWKLMRESVEAMTEIWTNDIASYHGELVSFDQIISNPKPVQAPRPPVHIGAAFPNGMARAVRYADGWIPLLGRGDDDIAQHATTYRRELEKAGRDPDKTEVTVYASGPDEDAVERYRRAGINRIVFALIAHPDIDNFELIDRYATVAGLG
ncbi:MAG: LLM class F420-dependent oxidoreductase [Acidimicrobiia bacterium]|nr:LLM class F420-dependent oxidoreductase [Acidimicrobiia bacterium]